MNSHLYIIRVTLQNIQHDHYMSWKDKDSSTIIHKWVEYTLWCYLTTTLCSLTSFPSFTALHLVPKEPCG